MYEYTSNKYSPMNVAPIVELTQTTGEVEAPNIMPPT